jgi:hypothetical protein
MARSATSRQVRKVVDELEASEQFRDPAPKRGPGRPLSYTPEVADELCERVEAGEPIKQICRDAGMPDWKTLLRWRRKVPEFATQYAHAREASAESLELAAIEESEKAVDSNTAAAARVRVDTLKWAAAKRHPRVYGERIDANISGALSLSALVAQSFKLAPPEPAPTIEGRADDATDD